MNYLTRLALRSAFRRSLGLALTLSAAAWAPLGAQETDSLPFRPGQRGFQFMIGNADASIGFIRFASARSAWVTDIGLDLSRIKEERRSSFGGSTGTDSDRSTGGAIRLSTGLRTHRPMRQRALGFWGAGVTGGYARSRSGENFRSTSWGGGFYGELGASYHVSPRMSFGGQASATLSYEDQTSRQTATIGGGFAEVSRTTIGLHTESARLLVAFYF